MVEKYNKMVALGEQSEVDAKVWIPYGSRFEAYYQEKLKYRKSAYNWIILISLSYPISLTS